MAKFSPNSLCPCGSYIKYKKCCSKYHKGALAPTAQLLMKSRYSAYATGESLYIIQTTHSDNHDFTTDIKTWQKDINHFSEQTEFLDLKIVEVDEGDRESYITFHATLSSGKLIEKSHFLKIDGRWLYVNGVFSKD